MPTISTMKWRARGSGEDGAWGKSLLQANHCFNFLDVLLIFSAVFSWGGGKFTPTNRNRVNFQSYSISTQSSQSLFSTFWTFCWFSAQSLIFQKFNLSFVPLVPLYLVQIQSYFTSVMGQIIVASQSLFSTFWTFCWFLAQFSPGKGKFTRPQPK